MYVKDKQALIRDDAQVLKLRVTVSANCGERGHRAYLAILALVSQSYWWLDVGRKKLDFLHF